MEYPKELSIIKDTRLIGYWHNEKILVFDVTSVHGFNQIVGYVKHINANEGTVLYRGQTKLHPTLVPSIMHGSPNEETLRIRETNLSQYVDRIINDERMKTLLHFGEDTNKRLFYKQHIVESMLQHYGLQTHFQDFVDNHWTALWFGLFECKRALMKDATKAHPYYWHYYERREHTLDTTEKAPECLVLKKPVPKEVPTEPILHKILPENEYTAELIEDKKALKRIQAIQDETQRQSALSSIIKYQIGRKQRENAQLILKYEKEKKRIQQINQIAQEQYNNDLVSDTAYCYILLYVADTCGESFKGAYAGTETITIDLRKALPSTLLLPCAQHGWTVRRLGNNYDLSDGVVCVLRLSVALVDEMMGTGALVSQNNFFPPLDKDDGYRDLLGREEMPLFDNGTLKYKRNQPSLFPYGTLQHFIEKCDSTNEANNPTS